MKLFPLIITITFLSFSVFAQSNFQSAQITTTDGAIVKGYIDYNNWKKTPETISFKATLEGDAKTFYPIDLKNFTIGNQYFVSQEIVVETSPRGDDVTTEKPEVNLKSQITFLRKLVEGKKELFIFVDDNGHEHFYYYHNNYYKLLLYKEYIEKIGGDNSERKLPRTNKTYIQQLESYLNDCPIINSYLSSTDYNEKSMVQLFQNYYNYFKLDSEQLKEENRGLLRYGLMIGGSVTQANFEARELDGSRSVLSEYLGESKYNRPIGINGGLFVNYILPRSKRKLVFTSELFFYSFQTEGFREDVQEFIAYYDTLTVGYLQMNLNLGLKYQYPLNDKLGIYARLGIINSLLLRTRDSDWRRTITFPSGAVINEKQEDVFNTFPYENGFLIGVGIQNPHLFLEILS